MTCVHFVRLACAVAITAIQWVTFSTAFVHTQSMRTVAACHVADHAADDGLPVIVIRAHRHAPRHLAFNCQPEVGFT